MDNLNDIINSLSDDDINMLKGVASSILGDDNSTSSSTSQKQQNPLGIDGVDFDMLLKAKSLFEKMNSTKSKNADLILALKPHLSQDKQNKADEALRILRLFEVLPLLKELF